MSALNKMANLSQPSFHVNFRISTSCEHRLQTAVISRPLLVHLSQLTELDIYWLSCDIHIVTRRSNRSFTTSSASSGLKPFNQSGCVLQTENSWPSEFLKQMILFSVMIEYARKKTFELIADFRYPQAGPSQLINSQLSACTHAPHALNNSCAQSFRKLTC